VLEELDKRDQLFIDKINSPENLQNEEGKQLIDIFEKEAFNETQSQKGQN